MLVTRRKLAAVALSSAAALAQAPAPPLPSTPDQELEAAREQLRRSAEAMARFPLPMATEPACHFKA